MSNQVEVKNLSHAYDVKPVLKDVSIEIEEGSFTGVVGPNGSGKTTLVKHITRTLDPDRRTVYISGSDVRDMDYKTLARKVATVRQTNVIEYDFSVEDVVMMGRSPHLRRFQKESASDRKICEDAMVKTDVWHLRERSVKDLSGGERQRVVIARALAQEPDVLVLDEPVTHLDIRHQIGLMELVKALSTDRKMTVVAVLHDLNFALSYCDKLYLVDHGDIRRGGQPDTVLTEESIKAVYGIDVCIVPHPRTGRPYIVAT